jgi:hypothetical protein
VRSAVRFWTSRALSAVRAVRSTVRFWTSRAFCRALYALPCVFGPAVRSTVRSHRAFRTVRSIFSPEVEEGTANSRRRARKEVEEQARGKGGATGAAVHGPSSSSSSSSPAAAVLVATDRSNCSNCSSSSSTASSEHGSSSSRQRQSTRSRPAVALHKKQTASPSLAAAFYRAFRCASHRSTHV